MVFLLVEVAGKDFATVIFASTRVPEPLSVPGMKMQAEKRRMSMAVYKSAEAASGVRKPVFTPNGFPSGEATVVDVTPEPAAVPPSVV